ncbi:MAG: ATP-binding protein, partial [Phototrophicaceae bacterium]
NLIRALTETKQSVKAIFADTETPIFSLNISDKLLFTFHDLSVAYLQTFKQDYDTLVNQNPKDIASLPSPYVSTLLEYARKCFASGRPLRYQVAFTLGDEMIVLLTHLSPLRDDDGRIYRIMGLCLDLSDKLAYEEEQLRTYELHSALSKAQELNRYKAEVTTLVAHEFQTPLSVINTSLYMMEKNSDGQPIEHRLGQITRQVNLLQQLMQRIIDLNQGAMMEQELDLAEVNFPEFVNNIINDLITSFPDGAPITFTAAIPENLIVTDTELMRQIVSNIVSNALKYSAQSKLPIQVTCFSDNRHFSFVVKDQGIGIPKEDLETIFDFFKRGRNAENHQGIGVGLMVVKQAVHRLGGTIVITSEEGEGTTVTINLPLAAVYPNTST